MKLAVDVYYFEARAKAVGIEFVHWNDEQPLQTHIAMIDGIEAYVPGEFYKRELPCILKLLEKLKLEKIEVIVIDGYVILDDEGTYGLGGHLYEALQKQVPIIGVAKRSFKGNTKNVRTLNRGKSANPLYITAIGMKVEEAQHCIKSMHGQSRIPFLLKYVDRKTRE